jgi:esterase/lipase superfamily enzyme
MFVALTLLCCHACAGQAKDSTAGKFITIPIYYVTDRNLKGDTYGNKRRYPTNCLHHMYYGTAMVTVPNKDNKPIDDKLKALGWESTEKRGAKVSQKNMIDASHPVRAKEAFNTRLIEALNKENTSSSIASSSSTASSASSSVSTSAASSKAEPQLCLFVHGAADAFEDSLQDAAILAYYLEKPLVLYSWPSDPHLRGYFIDGTNIEWSQKHFNLFCRDLVELKAEHPMEVICLSHSMGNRMVIRALPVVYGKGLIADWEMISPDIDADTCRHYLMGFSQPKAKVRLYVSNKDLILPFTQMISGGYYRLGEAANPAWELRKRGRGEYIERIDFTLVDKGWYGHSLPFRLVANMVHNDKPGEGFTLIPETSVHANAFARFAGHAEDFAPISSESDFCSRLVKVKQ